MFYMDFQSKFVRFRVMFDGYGNSYYEFDIFVGEKSGDSMDRRIAPTRGIKWPI